MAKVYFSRFVSSPTHWVATTPDYLPEAFLLAGSGSI